MFSLSPVVSGLARISERHSRVSSPGRDTPSFAPHAPDPVFFNSDMSLTRRQFLVSGASLLLGTAAPSLTAARSKAPFLPPDFDLAKGERSIDWLRPATGERLQLTYLRHGVWELGAYEKICHLLRDVQAKKSAHIDPTLIAIIDWTQEFLRQYGHQEPLHILSGYRSPQTNKKLKNAARNSQHLFGRAVDFRAPGVSSEYLGKLFRWLASGGVGIYKNANYVHVDTGRVRTWRG